MDFGKAENLDDADLTLPPDHPDTALVLKAARSKKKAVKVYVGCAKWGRKEWVGKIYPEGTSEKDFLKYYAQNYNCIELNAVHYRIPPAAWVEKWKDTAGDNFVFSPKFYKGISHVQRLKNADDMTNIFLDRMEMFGNNLGTLFLQLPPNYGPKNFPFFEKYLRSLPKNFSFAVEFRHPDWFAQSNVSEETFHLLKEEGISTVITDAAGRRDVIHQRLTTPLAFIRFVGNSLHPTDYSRIDDWVIRCKQWLEQGLNTLYFYMHHHDERYSPELSTYLIKQLNSKCGLKIKEPQWVTKIPAEATAPPKKNPAG